MFYVEDSKEFLAESEDYDVVVGQLAPVENTDYDANTAQDGSGTDISRKLTSKSPHPNPDGFRGCLGALRFPNSSEVANAMLRGHCEG